MTSLLSTARTRYTQGISVSVGWPWWHDNCLVRNKLCMQDKPGCNDTIRSTTLEVKERFGIDLWDINWPQDLHRVSKNDTLLVCYNFDTCERILTFFGENVTDKVSNQKTLFYATPNTLCFCITWRNGETWFFCIFTQILQEGIAWIQLAAWFRQSLWPTTHNLLNLVINAFSSGLTRGMVQDKRSRALQKFNCVVCAMHQCVVFWIFLISQGNAEALDRWGWKTKIAWFRASSVTRLPKIIIIG